MMLALTLGRSGPRSPWARFLALRRQADALLYEEIRSRRADPRGDQGDDIFSLLLAARDEDGEPLTDSELRDELMTLLVAGHETTATALAWALERLTRSPAVLDRLVDERAAGESAYMDAVIKETLRLRPVVPAVVRRLKAPMRFGPWELPEGVHIAPSIYLMHRRADLYPEPLEFRPERFLGDDAPGTYEWIPFGGGVRRCLGRQLRDVRDAGRARHRARPGRPAAGVPAARPSRSPDGRSPSRPHAADGWGSIRSRPRNRVSRRRRRVRFWGPQVAPIAHSMRELPTGGAPRAPGGGAGPGDRSNPRPPVGDRRPSRGGSVATVRASARAREPRRTPGGRARRAGSTICDLSLASLGSKAARGAEGGEKNPANCEPSLTAIASAPVGSSRRSPMRATAGSRGSPSTGPSAATGSRSRCRASSPTASSARTSTPRCT